MYLTHPGTLDWHITRKTGVRSHRHPASPERSIWLTDRAPTDQNPLEFVIVERFTDQTAFTYHSESSTCKDFVERVTPIVTGNDIQM